MPLKCGSFLVKPVHEELSPVEKHLLSWLTSCRGEGKAAGEELPGEFAHTLQPPRVSGARHPSHDTVAFPNTVLSLSETGGVRVTLSQVCLWMSSRGWGFLCLTVTCCPVLLPSGHAAGQASCRCSEPGPRLHLTGCVQANLSFFFHYPGMYCHLIFMYAILPDKYDLLPGNSSDVHSVPCSNYGSHS